MKKNLLFLFLLGLTNFTFGQVVMENHLPPFGTTFTLYSISGAISNAASGANQTWDYDSKVGSSITSYTVVDPATLPTNIKDSVLTATYGNQLSGPSAALDAYDFYSDKTSCYVKVGKKNSGNGSVEKTNDTIIMFNMTFGSTAVYGKLNNVSRNNKYDGYGTLKIDGKTYSNVVKMACWVTGSSDTLFQFFQFVPHFQQLLSYARIGGNIQNVLYWKEYTTTSGIVNHQKTNFTVYPNPSNGIVNILSEEKEFVEVKNILGETVYQAKLDINGLIDLTQMKNGVYYILNSSGSNKVIIQK